MDTISAINLLEKKEKLVKIKPKGFKEPIYISDVDIDSGSKTIKIRDKSGKDTGKTINLKDLKGAGMVSGMKSKSTGKFDLDESVEDFILRLNEKDDSCQVFRPSDIKELQKFADRLLDKFGVDINFTKHFGDRMSDDRNTPCIKMSEIKDMFNKVASDKAKKLKLKGVSEAVLIDMQKKLNIPFIVKRTPNGDFDITLKTVMRKKGFKTSNKRVVYEDINEKIKYPKGFEKFIDVAKKSKDGKAFVNNARSITGVPSSTAEWFRDKYDPEEKLSMEKVSQKFIDDVAKGLYEGVNIDEGVESISDFLSALNEQMEVDDFLKDVDEAVSYFDQEFNRIFSNNPHIVGRLVPSKSLSKDRRYTSFLIEIGDKKPTNNIWQNSKGLIRLMCHLTGRGGNLVPMSTFEIEMLSMSHYLGKSGAGIKYRKIKGKSPTEAVMKVLKWLKKNKDAINSVYEGM